MSKVRSILSLLFVFALSISVVEAGQVYTSITSSELEGENRFEEEEDEESIHSQEYNDVSHYSIDGGPNVNLIAPPELELSVPSFLENNTEIYHFEENHTSSIGLFLLFCCLKLDI